MYVCMYVCMYTLKIKYVCMYKAPFANPLTYTDIIGSHMIVYTNIYTI